MSDFIYLKIKIVRRFQPSPTRFGWYANARCDAFQSGRFTEDITEVRRYARSPMLSVEAQVRRHAKAVSDETERLFSEPTATEVSTTDESEYLAYIRSVTETAEWIPSTRPAGK